MPVYVFESDDGLQVERDFPVSECPAFVEVHGVRHRKVIAPVSILTGSLEMRRDTGHELALARAREKNEWHIAVGGDVEMSETDGRTPDALATAPRPAEIARKRDKYQATGQVPKRLAYLTKDKNAP